MSELDVQRRLTKAFIDTQPETVVFTPQVQTKTAGGGVSTVLGAPRPPLVVRFVEPNTTGQFGPVRAADGLQMTMDFMIIAEYDAVIEEGDVFTYQGHEYVVQAEYHDNGYEIRVEAVRRGY